MKQSKKEDASDLSEKRLGKFRAELKKDNIRVIRESILWCLVISVILFFGHSHIGMTRKLFSVIESQHQIIEILAGKNYISEPPLINDDELGNDFTYVKLSQNLLYVSHDTSSMGGLPDE